MDGVWTGTVPVETTPMDFKTAGSMLVMLAPVSISPFTLTGGGIGILAFCKASARGLLTPQRKSSSGPSGVIGSVKCGT